MKASETKKTKGSLDHGGSETKKKGEKIRAGSLDHRLGVPQSKRGHIGPYPKISTQ